ncbi:pantoate kinase [Natrinema thermotolerans]|uniref:Pantoate kinase n=1 Tax=Natrinema thermotolerans TaxID=121872 RepID=A0AAF0P8X9_9EURY|nr:pantoate kinase [Natrinema thermotolerans]QCC59689.1 sugar kinase [Natrinema thermotolerans]WMT06672.1 pantoate kinase [Natrinema thermotolerans]
MREEATAFVPGHVTGFFSAHPDDDPTKAGSRGAGLTLTDGVEVTVERAAETTVFLDDVEIEIEPVETVLETLDVSARIDATSELPIGSGFGVSGAMALGTALAANRVFGCKLSMNELVTIAHGAEVQAGTGLGDVVAQAHGGVPIRLEPGGPQDNKLDAVPARARVEYVTFGELSTADVLSGDTEQLTAAGQEALSRVVEEPTLLSFMYASRLFARDAELLTDRVRETIAEVSDADGQASMAMLGETVFALGTGLSDAGYEPSVCATHPAGAVLK